MRITLILAALVGLTLFQSCGTETKASTTATAEIILGPAGFTCFAIVQDGQAVGGNCLAN